MSAQSHRPPGTERREHYLPQVAKELERLIVRAQGSLAYNTLRLSDSKLEELASVLVEFAEDIHNGIGIWKSVERYNIQFFGTPLPLTLQPDETIGEDAINKQRVQHLLWILYSELNPELLISPTHRDLKKLASIIATFLENRFTDIPRHSSVKTFLSGPNRFGWEVKTKLIWLGTHSYLFRNSFWNYVQDHGGKRDIPVIDDFVCQQATSWSGLGVIDILAAILHISKEQRSALRSWYERHAAYYRIVATEGQESEVTNIINEKPYTVRYSADKNPFQAGAVVFGSLVPWNGEWYWSGTQQIFSNITEQVLQELKDAFLKKAPEIAYRYCSQLAEKAKQSVDRHYREFKDYHGGDLAIYPNGLSMAADLQREARLQWECKPKEVIAELMETHKLKKPEPSMPFPRELLENEKGVGVYYNPDEGQEIMTGFNNIVSGLRKKGVDLSKDEEKAIQSFIWSDSISPKFVRRLTEEYGSESIESAFLIRGSHDEAHINYLLRRYKGAYYRNRYPRVALV